MQLLITYKILANLQIWKPLLALICWEQNIHLQMEIYQNEHFCYIKIINIYTQWIKPPSYK